MNSAMKKTTIEGLTSPAALAASTPRSSAAPVFKVDLRRSLRMHTTAAICVGAAVLLAVVGYAATRKPTYQAKSITYIEPLSTKVLSDGTTSMFDPTRYDSYLQQQMQTALRPDILESALSKLPPGTWQEPGETTQSAVARLQTALKIERVTSSYQLSITLTGPDPVATAATVNAVTDAYLEQGRRDEHAFTDKRLKLLGEERQRIQEELDQDRTEQAQLGQILGVANPIGDGANPYDMQLAGVRGELQTAREAHDVAAAQLASLHNEGGARSPGLIASADDLIAGDAGLSSMKSTINQRKALLSTQMAGLTPSNPVYKQDQDEIADLDRSLDTMTTKLRDQAEHRLEDRLGLELKRTGDIEGRLNAQLAQQTATATNAGPRLQRAAELSADLIRLTTRYATVDDAMRGMELESNGPGLAHLSVAAAVPSAPEASRKKLLLLAAIPLALFAGCLVAVILQRRDPHVYLARDVEDVLGFAAIGVLPARAEVSEAVIEEYMLRLAAGLESAYRVSDARSYVLTGASARVDVSEFVGLLARKLGELGLTTSIIEPRRLLQPMGSAGEQAPAVSREGFAMANLEGMKAEHDLLLIDSPPLLYSAETEYAVRCTDATILIAECGVTLRTELAQSASLLERLNVAGVGAVLQEVHLNVADARYRAGIAVLEGRADASPARGQVVARERAEVAAPVAVASEPMLAEPEPTFAETRLVEPVWEHAVAEPVAAHVAEVASYASAGDEEPAAEHVQAPVVEAAAEPEQPVVAPLFESLADKAAVEPVAYVPEPLSVAPTKSAALNQEEALEHEETVPKKGWLQRLFQRDAQPAVSIIPDADSEEDELHDGAVLQAQSSRVAMVDPAPEPEIDIAPVSVGALAAEAQTAAEPNVQEYAPVAMHEAQPEVVQMEAQAAVQPEEVRFEAVQPEPLQLEAVMSEVVQDSEPVALPVDAFAEPIPEPEIRVEQSFEEPAFTPEPAVAAAMPESEVAAAPAPVAEPMPEPVLAPAAREVPVPFVPAAGYQPWPRPVEPAAVSASEPRRAYVPPVQVPVPPAPQPLRSSIEPFTTGRWEPVRAPRPELNAAQSGTYDAASAGQPSERGVSRISGGRRALAVAEARSLDPRPVRAIPASGWVPPAPALRNVNPLAEAKVAPRTGSLTRRWELLSRFDRTAGTAAETTEERDALTVPSRSAEARGGR